MKIYLSADIEGVCGICNWNETTLNKPDYEYFRQEMIKEINSCCQALIDQGITDIYVRDAHDSARNIIPSSLLPCVKLIRGWENSPWDMMAGLDESFDGAIFIGYHSESRSNHNPLSHTMSTSINHIKINNKKVSEFLLNAYYAKLKKVPVIMVTGDLGLTKTVKEENSLIETVDTFTGMHGAVIAKHPDVINKAIYDATIKAITTLKTKKDELFLMIPRILETEIHYRNHLDAYRASFYPNAYMISSDKTGHKTNDFIETLKFIFFTI